MLFARSLMSFPESVAILRHPDSDSAYWPFFGKRSMCLANFSLWEIQPR